MLEGNALSGADSALPPPRILFVGGFGRSGSTLLERLLGELPNVWPAGEIVHLWQRGIQEGERCGCGRPFRGCPFWQKVGQIGFGGWDNVDINRWRDLQHAVDRNRHIPFLAAPILMSSVFRESLMEYLDYYRRVYSAIRKVSGSDVLIDSSKHASLAFCLSRAEELDLRVVHIVRDSRAVAYSWTRRVRRPEAADVESYMNRYAPASAALQWSVQNSTFHMLAHSGVPTLRVNYENLVLKPGKELRRIAAFAGLANDTVSLQFLGGPKRRAWAQLTRQHTVSGNRMRFAVGRIEIRRDDEWREKLARSDRMAVSALTWPWLVGYGMMRSE